MSRKGETITLSLDAADKASLEKIAFQHGCTWGNKPNISALMKAIARQELQITLGEEIPIPSARVKQGRAAIARITQGLLELSAILF